MHELLYYSIFAIVLYFVLTQVFENFNIEQENFDPSLVPVSSIVTLAKVAQKLVNGNGTLTNPGNLQIGSSASAPGNLTVTGNTTVGGNTTITGNTTMTGSASINGALMANNNLFIGNKAMLYSNGDKFANDNWMRLMKADGATAYSGMDNGGLAVSNLYSQQDTTVNRNLQVNGSANVNGNINANGTSSFGGQGEFGFQWGNENNNGWSCLRTNRGNKENRLCFNRDHGLAHFFPGGHLDIQGKITVPRLETGTISATGNINARTDGFNTRIGGIWTAPGIYAEGGANLEIGSGSTNVYIGAANYSSQQNLHVTGEINLKTHRWHKSSDGKQRLHFSDNAGTHYGSGNGRHYFRTGDNGEGADGLTIEPGKATFSGQLCIHHVCINHDELNVLKLIARGGFRLQSDTDRCVDSGHGRDMPCQDLNGYQRFRIRNW